MSKFEHEYQYFYLSPGVEYFVSCLPPGDYAGVKHALREAEVYYNMDVNCLDPLGRSALLIAIENENLEIMELLLDHGIHTGDALLYAIRKEVVGAVELLLSHRRPSGEKQVRSGQTPVVVVSPVNPLPSLARERVFASVFPLGCVGEARVYSP